MAELKFSVAMCVYGGDNCEWFKSAVESVLNQTLKPNEIVLVVDGPIPIETSEIIKVYECNTIFKVIRLECNQGHGNARRVGLSACTNDLVAIMDSDDICSPNRFEKQIAAFNTDFSLDIVGGNITEFIGDESNVVAKRIVPLNDKEIKSYMKKRCPMNQMTVMFKKSSVEKAGGYLDWYCDEDYYLWLRMALADMKFANLQDVLVNVRVGKDMYKRRGGLKYYRSEKKLQKYMLKKKIISFPTYCANVFKRFILQVLLPNGVRGWVFKTFAREK